MADTGFKLLDKSNGEGHVLVERDGMVKYSGEEKWLDEFDEAVEGYFYNLKADDRPYAASRLKAQLFGRASDLTKDEPNIKYAKLEELAATKPWDAVRLLTAAVRKACSSAMVISQKLVFDTYFRTAKNRRWGEEVMAYKTRREAEYRKLCALNTGTALSDNLRNYFLVDGMGLSDVEVLDL